MEVDSLTSNLAVTLSHEVPLNDGVLTPMVRVGWQHEFGDLEHETKAAYMNQSGGLIPGKFNIGSVATDRDSFDGGLGLRAVFNSGSYGQMGLNLNYDLNVSKNANTHTISGGFEYRF